MAKKWFLKFYCYLVPRRKIIVNMPIFGCPKIGYKDSLVCKKKYLKR